jgi:hypothetical protein
VGSPDGPLRGHEAEDVTVRVAEGQAVVGVEVSGDLEQQLVRQLVNHFPVPGSLTVSLKCRTQKPFRNSLFRNLNSKRVSVLFFAPIKFSFFFVTSFDVHLMHFSADRVAKLSEREKYF